MMSEVVKSQSAPVRREGVVERGRSVAPVVNIQQDADGYTLTAELPGVERSGVEVSFEDGKLILVARKTRVTGDALVVHRESSDADYRRVFDLYPSVDASRIEASIEQGVLLLRLPKSESAKPRRISVK